MSFLKCEVAWIPCNAELSQNRLFELCSVRDNAIERFVEAYKLLTSHGSRCQTIDRVDLSKVDVVVFYGIAWN